jgi:cytochrome c-type biogenesis protein CcmH
MILGITLTVMTLAAIALVVLPLMRGNRASATRAAHEIEIYRDQLEEVDRDVARGVIGADEAELARTEIGRRMLAATDGVDTVNRATPLAKPRRITAIVTGLCVPALAIFVYVTYGSPDLPGKPAAEVRAAKGAAPQIPAGEAPQRQEVAKLAAALEKNPADLDSWLSLGNILTQMKRHRQAAVAYTQAMRLAPANAEFASRAGEALMLAAGGQVTPDAQAAFTEALRRDPGEPRAQFYQGVADQQGGRLRAALDRWVALEAASPPDAPWLRFLAPRIARLAGEIGMDTNALAALRERAPPMAAAPPTALPGPTREQMEAARNMSAGDRQAMIRNMVDGLAEKLKENPEDVTGWLRLGRARGVLGDRAAAKDAFAQAAKLRPDDVEILVSYADAIVSAAEPAPPPRAELEPLVNRILARDPDQPRGLWLSGALALSAGDTKTARKRWSRLLEFVDPNGVQYVQLKKQLDALEK